MHAIQPTSGTSLPRRPGWVALLPLLAATFGALPANAHELWIETAAAGQSGQEQTIQVCFGHPGHKTTGEMLQRQHANLTAWLVRPDGQTDRLSLAVGSDSFIAKTTPQAPGYYLIGAELQVGILTKEFHGIPANTRIVMYAKSFTHVQGSAVGLATPLGMDLEVVPSGDPAKWHPGDVFAVKLLFKQKPLGGKEVKVSLNTLGTCPFPKDPRVEGAHWSCENEADPRTGEVAFPLIVAGQHFLNVRYTDQTPGRYEGDQQRETPYSRLRKGDPYERTLYICNFSLHVKAK